MKLYEGFIRDNVDEFCREGIQLHLIGDSPGRPASLLRAAREAHEATRGNSEMVLMLAIGYSGRRDILRACRELAAEVQRDLLRPEDIDEALIAGKLGTSVAAGGELSCPDPDLVIRTSGELRLSNFLLWQSAFSELFFSDVMWPDFGEDEYLRALRSYQTRRRRFGQRIPCP
jgi:ditrans,polycis-polyprenyl diphosphate synthase